jgi:hypothetical protein
MDSLGHCRMLQVSERGFPNPDIQLTVSAWIHKAGQSMDNVSSVSPGDVTWVAWEPGAPWDIHGIPGRASQICRWCLTYVEEAQHHKGGLQSWI